MADKDNDGIPDDKDIDGGTGTNKAPASKTKPKTSNVSVGEWAGPAEGGTGTFQVFDYSKKTGTGSDGLPTYRILSLTSDQAKQYYSLMKDAYPAQWNAIKGALGLSDKQLLTHFYNGIKAVDLGIATSVDSYIENTQYAPATSSAGSTTTKQAQLYTDQSVKGIGNNVWMNELGREMTDKEAAALAKLMNAESKKNPSVYTSTTQTTGFAPTEYATQVARQQSGWGERQVGIRFMGILDKYLANPNILETMNAGA